MQHLSHMACERCFPQSAASLATIASNMPNTLAQGDFTSFSNIDRPWHVWQTMPGKAGKNPILAGAAAVMNLWAYTEADTRDITALGYTYA